MSCRVVSPNIASQVGERRCPVVHTWSQPRSSASSMMRSAPHFLDCVGDDGVLDVEVGEWIACDVVDELLCDSPCVPVGVVFVLNAPDLVEDGLRLLELSRRQREVHHQFGVRPGGVRGGLSEYVAAVVRVVDGYERVLHGRVNGLGRYRTRLSGGSRPGL